MSIDDLPTKCQKQYSSGQMICPRCKKVWDLDENVKCSTSREIGNEAIALIRLRYNIPNKKELK